jgi:hypothetical protein
VGTDGLPLVHSIVYDWVFDKEHKIRNTGSCAFDDWFGVYEANVGEAEYHRKPQKVL